jgi:hypothetical protein
VAPREAYAKAAPAATRKRRRSGREADAVEANHYAALERLAEANAEARALAEVLCYFAALRGDRPDPEGPPVEALPSA